MGDLAVIGAVLTALAGVIAAAVQLLKVLRSPSRQTLNGVSLVDASSDVVQMYREALDEVRAEIVGYKDEVSALRAELGEDEKRISALGNELAQVQRVLSQYRLGVRILINQIRGIGQTPEWEPGEEVEHHER